MRNWVTILLILLSRAVIAQEGQFSQYFASSIFINPAFAGVTPQKSIGINYKKRDTPQQGTFSELSQATFSLPLLSTTSETVQNGGVAFTFFRHSRGFQGLYKTQKALITGAYSLRLNRLRPKYLVFGLQSGVAFNSIDGAKLQWGVQYNKYIGFDDSLPGEFIDGNLNAYPVFNFGIVFASHNHDNIYIRDRSLIVGLSVDNINRPKTSTINFSENKQAMLFKGLVVSEIEVSPRTSLHPTVLALYQNKSYQANLGAYWSHLVSSPSSNVGVLLQVGAWYRINDSLIGLMGLQVNRIKFGVSFDFNSEAVTENLVISKTNSAFEVSMSLDLNNKNRLNKILNPLF